MAVRQFLTHPDPRLVTSGAAVIRVDASVRADFDDTRFKHKGLTSRFFKRGDKFFVNTEGPDGKAADFEIKYTFGYEPLQQYLIETTDGRLQPLTIAWDTRNRKWFQLFPDEITPPGDVLHWSGRYQTANTMCISCHTTAFEKRYDAAADRFDSRWAEVNVSCQSCHGPGQRYVDWARAQADGKAPAALPNHGLSVANRGATAQQQVQACTVLRGASSVPTTTSLAKMPVKMPTVAGQFDASMPIGANAGVIDLPIAESMEFSLF